MILTKKIFDENVIQLFMSMKRSPVSVGNGRINIEFPFFRSEEYVQDFRNAFIGEKFWGITSINIQNRKEEYYESIEPLIFEHYTQLRKIVFTNQGFKEIDLSLFSFDHSKISEIVFKRNKCDIKFINTDLIDWKKVKVKVNNGYGEEDTDISDILKQNYEVIYKIDEVK